MDVHVGLIVFILAVLARETYRAWSAPRNRTRRAMRRAKDTAIADLQDGEWAKVTGMVGALAPTITSPIGKHECIGYRLEIDATARRGPPMALERGECRAFSVTDGTGKIDIEGPFLFGMDEGAFLPVPRASLGVLREFGIETSEPFIAGMFMYRETLLRPGDRVSVLGLAFHEPDPTAHPEGFRSPVLAPRMQGSATQPIVVADAPRLGR